VDPCSLQMLVFKLGSLAMATNYWISHKYKVILN